VRVFVNRMSKRIFKQKIEEIIKTWRKEKKFATNI